MMTAVILYVCLVGSWMLSLCLISKKEAEMKLHPIHLNRTIKTERPIALTRSDLRKLERVAEHCRQSGTPLHWMIREVALQRLHESHRKRSWWQLIPWRSQ